jgi:hypothetical protein
MSFPKNTSESRAEREAKKQEATFQQLKQQIQEKAPSTTPPAGSNDDVRVEMAVIYRDYYNGDWQKSVKLSNDDSERLQKEIAVSRETASTKFDVSAPKIRAFEDRREKKGNTAKIKPGRKPAMKPGDADYFTALVSGHAISDEVLDQDQQRSLLRDIFAGLKGSRLDDIKSGKSMPSSGVFTTKR